MKRSDIIRGDNFTVLIDQSAGQTALYYLFDH